MVDVPVLGTGVFNVSVRVRPKATNISSNVVSLFSENSDFCENKDTSMCDRVDKLGNQFVN
jgi:hypothetical protein